MKLDNTKALAWFFIIIITYLLWSAITAICGGLL